MKAFAALVSAKYPDHIRWSIHSGNLQGPKFSISLINTSPNATLCASATPWHNVLLENNDGEVFALRKADVDLSKYSLILRDGLPWAFKEIPSSSSLSSSPSSIASSLSSLSTSCCHAKGNPVDEAEEEVVDQKTKEEWKDFQVEFKKLQPFGLMIIAKKEVPSPPIHVLPKESIRRLILNHSTLVLRGFAKMSKDDFVEGTRRFGYILFLFLSFLFFFSPSLSFLFFIVLFIIIIIDPL